MATATKNRTLHFQSEVQRSFHGVYYGLSVYDNAGTYEAVIHARTYEGKTMRVASKHDVDVPIKATTYDDAVAEAKTAIAEYINTVHGLGGRS